MAAFAPTLHPSVRRPAPAAAQVSVSLIIPTYNEAPAIGALLDYLLQATAGEHALEIIVADGGSTDGTPERARRAGVTVLRSPRKGRAAQMNYGARKATGELLYFLHADSFPPPDFLLDLRQSHCHGFGSGCYRLAFDHPHWFLRFSAWCTRFSLQALRFGDQSLFVRRDLFARVRGFREDLLVMEDQEIIGRLQAREPFRLLPRAVTTSARKYLDNGVFRLQGVFTLIAVLYWLGVSQPHLLQVYRQLIRQSKL